MRIRTYQVGVKLTRVGKLIEKELNPDKIPLTHLDKELGDNSPQLIPNIAAELDQENNRVLKLAEITLSETQTEAEVKVELKYLES